MTKRVAISTCLVLLALATALLGAGCGSGTADPVASAATTSNSAPGFRMTFAMTIGSSTLTQPVVATGNGAFDIRDHAAQMTFDMSIPQLKAVMPASGGALHMNIILRDRTLYMRMPAILAAKLPGSRPWLKLDASKLGSGMGTGGLGSLFDSPGMQDPSQFLQYLRGVSGNVTKVGTDVVGGVRTTHYRASIDLEKALSRLSGSNAAAGRRLGQLFKALLHSGQLPVDVWIDSSDHVRRMAFHMNASVGSGQSMTMAMQLTIPQYGPQPEPQAPPAGQVTDLGSMMGPGATSSAPAPTS